MKNVFEYYDKTRNMGPNGLLVEVVEKYIKTGTVIDQTTPNMIRDNIAKNLIIAEI